jgi:beta-lactamase superfamily II metal-dependent hydrolase
MTANKANPPQDNEIELTLLGPGYGESIVIHIGNNFWVAIDSCIDIDKKSCATLDYLNSIGVNPSNVLLIVATHWHDDHVKGLSNLIEACSNARFSCSSALSKDEFLAYVTKFETDCKIKWGSGVSEFYKTLDIIRKRKSSPHPIHATSNRRILYKSPEELNHSSSCEIWSLSPSDGQIANFISEIKNVTPINNEPKSRAHQTRNNISVVIQIIIGNETLLLGSDLEETNNDYTGWSVIVDSTEKPKSKAKIFKIPHHGSSTAHSHDVWTKLIENESFALLTPFNRGKKLPSSSDIQRIQKYSENAFSTASLNAPKTIKRNSLVEKTITATVGKIRPLANKIGMIRLRKNINDSNAEWNIELFNGACHLSAMN